MSLLNEMLKLKFVRMINLGVVMANVYQKSGVVMVLLIVSTKAMRKSAVDVIQ